MSAPILTIDALMALEPCDTYPLSRVETLWEGRPAPAWRENLNLLNDAWEEATGKRGWEMCVIPKRSGWHYGLLRGLTHPTHPRVSIGLGLDNVDKQRIERFVKEILSEGYRVVE